MDAVIDAPVSAREAPSGLDVARGLVRLQPRQRLDVLPQDRAEVQRGYVLRRAKPQTPTALQHPEDGLTGTGRTNGLVRGPAVRVDVHLVRLDHAGEFRALGIVQIIHSASNTMR